MVHTTGKQALLEILKQEGVGCIFGNPGTTELPLMDALVKEPSLHYILALHESIAIGMADGYALAGSRLGVVNVHIAPGLANSLGMLYNAQKAGAPILVTAGQHDQSFTSTEPVVWADLPPIAQPFVKWSGEVRRPEDLPRLVHRAAKTALPIQADLSSSPFPLTFSPASAISTCKGQLVSRRGLSETVRRSTGRLGFLPPPNVPSSWRGTSLRAAMRSPSSLSSSSWWAARC